MGWGATNTAPQNGGQRWRVPPGNEMIPAGGISWRVAAIYCNWLHNEKSLNRDAFMDGAYSALTFGNQGSVFTDQLTHNPNARYWIPTWDEWLKAAHWSPNNPNLSGWYTYGTGSNSQPAYGPPGVNVRVTGGFGPDPNGPLAQANAGWSSSHFPGYNPYSIHLGAYGITSPWGLFDTAGAAREWTEEALFTSDMGPQYRRFDGSAWDFGGPAISDLIYHSGGDPPWAWERNIGFRIAGVVPSPPSAAAITLAMLLLHRSRRRHPVSPRLTA
jgi:formylglycine-generating enzyme required for sulfatase activity